MGVPSVIHDSEFSKNGKRRLRMRTRLDGHLLRESGVEGQWLFSKGTPYIGVLPIQGYCLYRGTLYIGGPLLQEFLYVYIGVIQFNSI